MSEAKQAYPLQWPVGWKRTTDNEREGGTFTGTQDSTLRDLLNEIDLLILGKAGSRYRAEGVIISTNIPLRSDGLPYVENGKMPDPGVAVYFKRKGKDICIASDKYDRVWKNMKAILKTINAMRGIERWGASELLDRAFLGFAALPEHGSPSAPSWRDVFDLKGAVDAGALKARYRELSKQHHPDTGGDAGTMAMINRAYEMALEEVGA